MSGTIAATALGTAGLALLFALPWLVHRATDYLFEEFGDRGVAAALLALALVALLFWGHNLGCWVTGWCG